MDQFRARKDIKSKIMMFQRDEGLIATMSQDKSRTHERLKMDKALRSLSKCMYMNV